MLCRDCRGTEFKKDLVNSMIDVDNKFYIIKNVPASVCNQCGETYYDFNTTLKLEEIIENLKNNKSEVTVAIYGEEIKKLS